ncbi:hypothetical protein Purlil1_3757 [Purpureocillium lilacinum]|uniref:Uncharacterized protein n=1 Tax=Purpureocillium lilacinum TaxID=33203 RepID=A0ABR0C6B5_PURLI|nr:hypothetical protein Purlil1_3757 [Purpureocillium lilacinum]
MFCQPAWGAPENISINLGRCRVPVGPAGQGGDLPVSNSSRHWYAWRSAGNVRARAFGACRFPWKARYVHRTRLAATTMDGSLDTVRIRGLNSLIKTSEQAARNRALHQRSLFLGNGVAAQKLQRKVSRYGRRSCASGRHERGGPPRPEARAATATADTTGRRADGQAARVEENMLARPVAGGRVSGLLIVVVVVVVVVVTRGTRSRDVVASMDGWPDLPRSRWQRCRGRGAGAADDDGLLRVFCDAGMGSIISRTLQTQTR